MNFSDTCNKTVGETLYDTKDDYELDPLNHNYTQTYLDFFEFDTLSKKSLIAFNAITVPINIGGHIVIIM